MVQRYAYGLMDHLNKGETATEIRRDTAFLVAIVFNQHLYGAKDCPLADNFKKLGQKETLRYGFYLAAKPFANNKEALKKLLKIWIKAVKRLDKSEEQNFSTFIEKIGQCAKEEGAPAKNAFSSKWQKKTLSLVTEKIPTSYVFSFKKYRAQIGWLFIAAVLSLLFYSVFQRGKNRNLFFRSV